MKLKKTPLAVLTAITLAGPASAATLLLSDNFNDAPNEDAGTFNNNLASTQSGTLTTVTPVTYNVQAGASWQAQHSNSGRMLLTEYSSVSLAHDFSVEANANNSPITIEFGYLHARSDGWGSFVISTESPDYIQDSTVIFGQLFLGAGGTQLFNGGASPYTTGSGFVNNAGLKFVLSNTVGTGSAFNGAGSVLKVYSNNSQINQVTLPQLGSGTYFSFGGGGLGDPGDPTLFDDLSISIIPEPSAALLGGLGLLALLRRKR